MHERAIKSNLLSYDAVCTVEEEKLLWYPMGHLEGEEIAAEAKCSLRSSRDSK